MYWQKKGKKSQYEMSSIVIVDFDGVIADHSDHTKIAQERARAFVREQAPGSESKAERKALSTFFIANKAFLILSCSNTINSYLDVTRLLHTFHRHMTTLL